MASVKMTYVVQSCPVCQKKLLKVVAGGTIIGSPLLTCQKCGRVYKTALREEWYKYKNKWTLWGLPLILIVGMLVVGAMMGDLAIGIMAAIFGLILGLCFTIKDLIRMAKSKKRMRDAKYLEQLLAYQLITQEEYENFMRNAA